MGTKGNPIGEVGRTVADNIIRIRRRRKLTLNDMSWLLSEVGRPLLPSGCSAAETLRRNITVDDLAAFAKALDVSPLVLLGLTESPGPAHDPDLAIDTQNLVDLERQFAAARGRLHQQLAELEAQVAAVHALLQQGLDKPGVS